MKKIIDEKGRIFGRLSILDLVVLLVVLALCAAIYVRFFSKPETASGNNQSFTYELKISRVRSATVNAFRPGDRLYAKESGLELGTILSVSTEDVPDPEPEKEGADHEPRYNVFLRMEGDGLVSEGRYFAARRIELGVNDSMVINSKYCECTASVWSVGE